MPYALRFACIIGVALVSATVVHAQAAPPETALAYSAADTRLQWGSCPAFMPAGCKLTVLHGDPGKPNSDVLLMVPPNEHLAHHWHTSAERMVLLSGTLEVAYDGQQPATLKPGMYAYGPAKLPHGAVCQSKEPCVLFIAFEGPVDAVPTSAKKQ